MMTRKSAAAIALPLCVLACARASARPADDASAQILDTVHVTGTRTSRFSATTAHMDAERSNAAINAIDVEDMAKYLPSVFVRKRNFGDTQPVLATRNWGVNSSARTLVFVDGVPISALIANNNTLGAPRWNMVAPEQVDHIDMLYGPYSARYAGNAVGGVMNIVTRTPDKLEASVRVSTAAQDFNQYGTHDHYLARQTSATLGDRIGAFAWSIAANEQVADSQPLSYVTASTPPAGTSGAIASQNKLGQATDVLGAGGLLHTRQDSFNAALNWDIAGWLHANYRLGFWHDQGEARVQTYLRNADGMPAYAGAGGFASNQYRIDATHRMQALSLKTDSGGAFDGSLVATRYDWLRDRQLAPASANADASISTNGRDADNTGTGWKTLDAQGTWRATPGNELSLGAHADEYTLDGNTWNTAAWRDASTRGALYSRGSGRARTLALWIEDAWRFAPDWLATFGAREEHWQARDGENLANGIDVW